MRRHVLTAAGAFGLGVAVTLLLSGNGGEPRTGARSAAPRTAERGIAGEALRLEERLEKSRAEKAKLEETVEILTRRLEAYESGERGAARSTRPRKPGGPRFVYAETEKALRVLNWDETAEAVAKLMPLLSEAAAVVDGKQELRPELFGEITRWSGPLFTHALKLEERDVEWSHPSVLVNLIHATLEKAGRPLGEQQEDELYRIGLRFIEQDQRRRAAHTDETLRLRQMIDEVRLQDRFYAEVDTILTQEQKAILHPPGVTGVVQLDVFAGSIIWEQNLDRVPHKDRAELCKRVTEMHAEELELRAEVRPVLAAVVKEWEAALPDTYVFAEPDAVRNEKMEHADRVLFTAARQAALFEALLARAPLNAEERRRVREQDQVLVPFLHR
jgi:hypothetical protein